LKKNTHAWHHRGLSQLLLGQPPAKVNWKPGTLGAIINQYKSICTKRIRTSGCVDFAWQARFYDRIIQYEKSLENIRSYIVGNPIKWTEDEYFSDI